MLDSRSTILLAGVMGVTLGSWSLSGKDLTIFRAGDKQTITLTGSAVRPNKVETSAKGTAVFTWDDHGGISYTLRVENLSSEPVSATINGPSDKDGTGPVLSTLDIKDHHMTGTIATGMIGASIFAHFKRDALKDLFDKGKAYIVVSTQKYPDGEIRGQFHK